MSQMRVNPVECSIKSTSNSGANDFSSVHWYRIRLYLIEAA